MFPSKHLRGARFRRWRFLLVSWLVLLVLLIGCGSQPGVQQGSQTGQQVTARPGVLASLSGMLTSIHMLNASMGWAVDWQLDGDGSYHILRTIDGGLHWQDTLSCTSTVDQGKGFLKPCSTSFYSASVATVVQPEYDQRTRATRTRIFHTADGGETWQSSELNVSDLQTPAIFVDALHGWALVTEHFPGPDSGSSYIGQAISLYRTVDGGQHWQRAAYGPATSQLPVSSDDGYGLAPLTANAQMAFVSSTTGWLMGRTYHSDNSQQAWLYVTHDGGQTWRRSSLIFPANEDAQLAPVFFNSEDGVLLASVTGSAPQYSQSGKLYTTHDGGQTWSGQAVSLVIVYGASIDLQYAWTLANDSREHVLYTTQDGWQHWAKTRMQTTFRNVRNYDFISPTVGWALADNRTHFYPAPGGGMQKGDLTVLLKTTDGGHTWQEIASTRA